jgi:hypothetical protein
MIEVILKLPSHQVLDEVLPLLKQLNIPYQTRIIEPIQVDASKKAEIIAKIKRGELNIPNFEAFMADFNKSR